jgi:septum formation protein
MIEIILASTSPRRKELMKKVAAKFKIADPKYREHHHKHLKPKELVKFLALGKARAAAKKYPRSIIVGADTVVVFRGEVLGKPKNKKDAERMLKKLRGNKHFLYTGYAVINTKTGRIISGVEVGKLYFKNYSDKVIADYIATGKPMDKAGAYAIQDIGRKLVKKYIGDRSTIIGLPVKRIKRAIKKFT